MVKTNFFKNYATPLNRAGLRSDSGVDSNVLEVVSKTDFGSRSRLRLPGFRLRFPSYAELVYAESYAQQARRRTGKAGVIFDLEVPAQPMPNVVNTEVFQLFGPPYN